MNLDFVCLKTMAFFKEHTGAQDSVKREVPVIDGNNLKRIIAELEPMTNISPTLKDLLSTTPRLLEKVSSIERLRNATFKITDDDKYIEVKAGNGKNEFIVKYGEDGFPDIFELSQKYINDTEHVKEINKRILGKAILNYCGNEGIENGATKSSLRRLFQLGIDQIHQMPDPNFWKNATVIVYDNENNSYTFQSGKGKHRFVANEVDGRPSVVYIVGNKRQKINMEESFTGGCCIL